MSEPTQELVRRALDGDRHARRVLVRRLYPRIQSQVARALLRHRAAALGRDLRQEVDDLTQDAFAALFAKDGHVLRSWNPDLAPLEVFVGLVARRQVTSIMRSRRRSPYTERPTDAESLEAGPAREASPEDAAAARELLGRILEELPPRLTPNEQMYFELFVVEQLSVEEAMERTGARRDAVYKVQSRIRAKARELRDRIVKGLHRRKEAS